MTMDELGVMKNGYPKVYRDENRDYFYDVTKMREFLSMLSDKNREMLMYSFDLLGVLEGFKLTKTGFSAIDGTGVRIVFSNRCNKSYKFYIEQINFVTE